MVGRWDWRGLGRSIVTANKLGEALIQFRTNKLLEGFKSEQTRELERLKAEQDRELEERGTN
ncbi:hypothetical protein [Bradyrhizobium japonicum]|uniref:hypothetical protein n=1 Tax=Bradyrhizobium japonicum TaxID=375 RepID=UPI00117C9270|nr:hypothetical protein [Bradyrhizobium japonicum]